MTSYALLPMLFMLTMALWSLTLLIKPFIAALTGMLNGAEKAGYLDFRRFWGYPFCNEHAFNL